MKNKILKFINGLCVVGICLCGCMDDEHIGVFAVILTCCIVWLALFLKANPKCTDPEYFD